MHSRQAISIVYHDVIDGDDFDSSGFPGKLAAHYKLEKKQFQQHIDAIQQAMGGLSPVTTDDPGPNQLGVYLTFDDGGCSALTCTADMLEEKGWRGHFFVTSACIGKRGFLTPSQMRDLRRRGHIIGSHSWHHPVRMALCPWDTLIDEWGVSTDTLSNILGEQVRTGAVPGGYYSRKVARAAGAAGITRLFTSEPTERPHMVHRCAVLGRYVVFRGTPPEVSGGLVGHNKKYRYEQQLAWKAKKAIKRTVGNSYLRIRQVMLGMGDEEAPSELASLLADEPDQSSPRAGA